MLLNNNMNYECNFICDISSLVLSECVYVFQTKECIFITPGK